MPASQNDLHHFFRNKKILVTGGTGSIGEKIVSTLLQYDPQQVVIFSKDDSNQYLMQQKYNHPSLHFCLGDIRDKQRVEYITRGIDYIFHAAALKQVPVCEDNPYEAVKTNIIGSENLIRASILNQVKKVVNISTDKAINPSNTMGATKLIAEKLFKQANTMLKNRGTRFCSVRFGNVIGSRGSVLPIFLEQARKGLPLTITDLNMTRFVMTIEQAANLTLKALYYCTQGETYILRMDAFTMEQLIEAVKIFCKNEGLPACSIKHIGIRSGEKLHEELLTIDEANSALEDAELYVIPPVEKQSFLHFKKAQHVARSSDQIPSLTASRLLQYLYAFGE